MLSRCVVIRAIGLVAAALALLPGIAVACTCTGDGGMPACEAFNKADAVFFGTVLSRDIQSFPVEGTRGVVEDKIVGRFAVEHAVSGVTGLEVDVTTGMGNPECVLDFREGQRYVVYAYRDKKNGSLYTFTCSGTRSIGHSSKDLAYFSAPAPGARVSGTIKHVQPYPDSRTKQYGGVADVRVILRGTAGEFSAITDAKGRYAIDSIPPGTYDAEVLAGPALTATYLPARTLEIKSAHACPVLDSLLRYAGRVAGTVLDAAGRPASGVEIEIATARSPGDRIWWLSNERLRSDANGRFELANVPPGSYVVGVAIATPIGKPRVYPRTLFPGTIEVGKGNRVDAGILRLPEPFSHYELKGVVVDPGGVPIHGAFVSVSIAFGQSSTPVRTGADGSFTLPVVDGHSYSVDAIHVVTVIKPPRRLRAVQTITIQGEPPPIRLVVR